MNSNTFFYAFVESAIQSLPRRDRRYALRLLREKPIRFLGACLRCGRPSAREGRSPRVGIYVPIKGGPLEQVVIYSLCPEDGDGDLGADEIEDLVVRASNERPHVPTRGTTI